MLNVGEEAVLSRHRLLTTVAYRLGGRTTYALEGSIFVAGAAIQWLRDALHLFEKAEQTQALAASIEHTDGVYLVPAFTGLGAPYWDPAARGAILGLTRDTGIEQIVRAALESTCYQTRDLVGAIGDDAPGPRELRVDGGMAANDLVCGFLADILQTPVERPEIIETTALGAAYLAGLQVGLYESLEAVGALWRAERRLRSRARPPRSMRSTTVGVAPSRVCAARTDDGGSRPGLPRPAGHGSRSPGTARVLPAGAGIERRDTRASACIRTRVAAPAARACLEWANDYLTLSSWPNDPRRSSPTGPSASGCGTVVATGSGGAASGAKRVCRRGRHARIRRFRGLRYTRSRSCRSTTTGA